MSGAKLGDGGEVEVIDTSEKALAEPRPEFTPVRPKVAELPKGSAVDAVEEVVEEGPDDSRPTVVGLTPTSGSRGVGAEGSAKSPPDAVVEGSRSVVVPPAVETAPKPPGSDASALSRSSSSASSLSDAGESELMKIVVPSLKELAKEFDDTYAGADTKKKAAVDFIKKLNDYVIELGNKGAGAGGSRRALKRIMKKYSRRVSRKRGKRVKSSAQ